MKKVTMVLLVIVLISLFIPFLKLFSEPTDEGSQSDMLTGGATSSASVINAAPTVNLTTYSMYISSSDNKVETNFTICDNEASKKVYIQINITDLNSFKDITNDRNATFIIVLFNGITESTFERFSTGYRESDSEVSTLITTLYNTSFTMVNIDPERSPPLYYRIKSNASDGTNTTIGITDFNFAKRICGKFSKDFIDFIENETTIIDAIKEANASIDFLTTGSFSGSISIEKTTFSPVNFADFGFTALNKYLDISISDIINDLFTTAEIKVHYTDAEVNAEGLDASTLRLYSWDGTAWNELGDSTVDTVNKFVSGFADHFSIFGVFGDAVSTTSTTLGGTPTGLVGKVTEIVKEEIPEEILKEVEEEKPLFDVSLSIVDEYKKVLPGEDIIAEISLIKIAGSKVDVDVFYSLIDPNGKVISTKQEIVAVETKTIFVAKLTVPEDAKTGDYLFKVKAVLKKETLEASDSFEVIEKFPEAIEPSEGIYVPNSMILGILIIGLFIFALIFYYSYRQTKILTKLIHKITEEDLIKEGLIKRR